MLKYLPWFFVLASACAQTPCTQPACIDFDQDGSIDQSDLGVFQRCLGKSGVPYNPKCLDKPITPLPPSNVIVLSPNDDWQAKVNTACPGDRFQFRGGNYQKKGSDFNYHAGLEINNSGDPGKPIIFEAYPGEKPIFFGRYVSGNDQLTWAIRIGFVDYRGPNDPTAKGVHDVIVDGLYATQAPWDGIEVANSWNIIIRNCHTFDNNYKSTNGYKAGINLNAGHDILIDHCRIWGNGFGVCGYESQPDGHEWPNPDGPFNVVVSNNFIYANFNSANQGNSPGLDIRFASNCTYDGNIFYDNPDAGINGEGNIFCKITRNICINNWSEVSGANQEGGKVCVRGGGANIIAFNLFVGNGNCGWDATLGVGDIFLNNTCYGNGGVGCLMEGSECMMFNNISARNAHVSGDVYKDLKALGFSRISDFNTYGLGPTAYSEPNPPIAIPPNTKQADVDLLEHTMRRILPRRVVHPEEAFGCSTIEEARVSIASKYRPINSMPGAKMADIQIKCNQNIPTVKATCEWMIQKMATSPDFQMKQATHKWKQVKSDLDQYKLDFLTDTGIRGAVK